MTAYADYTFYTGTFLGVVISQSDFPALALRASEEIDAMTFNRAQTEDNSAYCVQVSLATCALAELLVANESSGGAITSEKVGSYAVTYAGAKSERQSEKDIVKKYLWSTGLLYRGILSEDV
jgi:hypothetical protein